MPTPMSSPSQHRQSQTGILLMCAAILLFAVNDSTAKYLSLTYSTLMVVWARYVSGLIFALAFSWRQLGAQVFKTHALGLQLVRSFLLLCSTGGNFLALRYMPLADAASILFTGPLFVCALSVPLLGEKVGWRRWTAIMVGFCGVLVVIRPGFQEVHWSAFASLGSALAGALYNIATRKVAGRDHPLTSMAWSVLVGALVLSLIVPFEWQAPEGWAWALFPLMGCFGTFGHFLLIRGHTIAPASILAPFSYTQIFWATAIGYFLFGNFPDLWTFVGAGIVIASGIYLLYRERKLGRGATAEQAPAQA